MGDVFFVVSKLAWGVLRADSLILIALGLGLLALWRGRWRLGRGLVSLGVAAWLIVILTPLPGLVLRPLEARHPVPDIAGPVAGIVILGGAEDQSALARWGQPGVNEAGERFLTALDLARRYPEAPVMFTGGSGQLIPGQAMQSEVARAWLTGAGLDPARLILEGASRNTAENARLAADLAPDRPGQWLFVTSAFHMTRAVETFCAAGWTGLTPYPVDFRSRTGLRPSWNPAESLVTLNTGLREWIGLVAYRATGRAAHPLPAGCLYRG
ncbi:YdcF family protein [Rhodovulum marinum]|uniref:Uncharacterized SAM-binding protein YcdF (DUF218 family) n=1 Tax=Rhodovulum marinum TaxID=320662 RepID=A0A4R2PSG0_9RHOB|nr:YdcF family protein [Rhodovulum marinum]TCP38024.1 uncharacterized SAM-binding protein YcdF (DUF218 family) [Rhodovulum marinum]